MIEGIVENLSRYILARILLIPILYCLHGMIAEIGIPRRVLALLTIWLLVIAAWVSFILGGL